MGAISGAFLALILPPILELAGSKGELPMWKLIKNWIIVVFGIIGGVTGTVLSIYDIVIDFSE